MRTSSTQSSDPTQASGRRFSIATWLTGAVLTTALCAILATVGLLEHFAHGHAERQADETLRQIAWNMRDALDRGMQQHLEQIRGLAGLDAMRRPVALDEARDTIDRLQAGFPQFAWVGLTDTHARVVAGSGGLLEGADVSKRPWYAGAQDAPYIGDVHSALLLAKLLPTQAEPWRFVDIAVPVLDVNGGRRGILAAHLSWEWARDIQANLLDPTLRDRGAQVLVLAQDGSVLLGPKSLVGQRRADLVGVPATSNAETSDFRVGNIDGERYFLAVAATRGAGRYPGVGWTVVVRQPAALALADFRQLRNEMLIAGALVAVAFCIVAAVVARRLASPLRCMALQIASGSGEVDVPGAGVYREAHQLAVALNAMTARQRSHATELEHLNASLEARIVERTRGLEMSNLQVVATQAMLRDITDNLPALIAYVDRDERVQFYARTYESWFGVAPEVHLGLPIRQLVGDAVYEQRRPFIEDALAGRRVSFTSVVDTGAGPRDTDTVYLPDLDADNRVKGMYALTTDITAMKVVERQLAALARFDTLTGLPNRYQLNERLPEALARCRRAGHGIAVLFIDVDHFKRVNDTLGHAAGDAVLKEFAQRLRDGVRETDTVARLAGDEFVVVLEGLRSAAEPQFIARKLVASVARPIDIDGCEVTIGGSVGIAFDLACTSLPADLLAQADEALYQAKQAGRSTYRLLTTIK